MVEMHTAGHMVNCERPKAVALAMLANALQSQRHLSALTSLPDVRVTQPPPRCRHCALVAHDAHQGVVSLPCQHVFASRLACQHRGPCFVHAIHPMVVSSVVTVGVRACVSLISMLRRSHRRQGRTLARWTWVFHVIACVVSLCRGLRCVASLREAAMVDQIVFRHCGNGAIVAAVVACARLRFLLAS